MSKSIHFTFFTFTLFATTTLAWNLGAFGGARGWVEDHNYFRCLHDAQPLQWEKTLEREASKWADELVKMYRTKGTKAFHSKSYDDPPPAGESIMVYTGNSSKFCRNLGEASTLDYSQSCAVLGWYMEYDELWRCHPRIDWRDKNAGLGHLTAMLWKGINRIGCAQRGDFFVCHYTHSSCINKKGHKACKGQNRHPWTMPNYKMKSCEDDECVECRNEEKYRHQKCGPNRVNLYAPYGHADGHPLTDQIWRQTLKTRSLPELPEPYTKKLLRFATKRKPPSVATQDTRKPTSENRAAKTRSVAAKRKAPSMVEKKQPGAEDDFGWLKDLAAKKFKPAPETPAPSSSQPASSIPSLERILSDLTQALDEEEMETTPRGPARLSSSNNSEKRATSKPKRSRPLPSVKRKTPSQEESVIPRLSFATQTRMPARSSSPIESMDDDSRPISNIPRLSFKVGPPPSSKRLWEAVDSAMDGR